MSQTIPVVAVATLNAVVFENKVLENAGNVDDVLVVETAACFDTVAVKIGYFRDMKSCHDSSLQYYHIDSHIDFGVRRC